MEPSHTDDTAILHTIPTPCAICQLCLAFIMCIGELWKVVECVVLGM